MYRALLRIYRALLRIYKDLLSCQRLICQGVLSTELSISSKEPYILELAMVQVAHLTRCPLKKPLYILKRALYILKKSPVYPQKSPIDPPKRVIKKEP